MKKLIILCCLVSFSVSASAGDTDKKSKTDKAVCTYTGSVLDADNAEALTGATIRLKEIDRVVYADFDGAFTFTEVPPGKYTLEISFVSYDTKVIENFVIEEGSTPKRFLL